MQASIFSEEHEALRAACSQWVATGSPTSLASAAAAGLLGLTVPEEHGGQGADVLAAVILAEELAAAPGLAGAVLEHGEIALPVLAGRLSDPAWQDVLRGDSSAVVVEGFTLDAGGLRGVADTLGRAPVAGAVVVADEGENASVWWLPAGEASVASRQLVGDVPSVQVTAEDAIGTRLGGPELAAFVRARRLLLAAATAAAGAEHVLARSRAYATQRAAFGKPIISFQALRHEIVDVATEAAAARALVHSAAEAVATAERESAAANPRLVAAAAAAAMGVQWRAIDLDVQVHGGMGYAMESAPAQEWAVRRAARLLPVTEAAVELLLEGPGPVTWAGALSGFADLRQRAITFLDQEVRPGLGEWSVAKEFPRTLFQTVGAAGWLAVKFDAPTLGEGFLRQAVWIEELARCGSGGLAADLGATTDLAAMYLHRAGDDDQRKRWLEPTLTGELIGGLAITEPGTGSDVAGITTRARRDGDLWVIDGAKVFITNGPWADYLVLAAKVSPEDGGGPTAHGQVTLFVVDGSAEGVTRRRLSMLGWNLSHTGELTFDGVRIGDDARLGEVGSGFGHIVANFAWERVSLAIGATTAAEEALRWFGDDAPVDLLVRVAAARALTEQALRLTVRQAEGQDDGAVTIRAVAMAKLATQALAVEVLDAAIQHVGVEAMQTSHPLQRGWRDARLGPIGGGTDQIMREIIGKTW